MKFRVICVDPPYSFSDKLKMDDVKRGAESQYDIITVPELRSLPIDNVAEDDSVLVLWCPASLLEAGLSLMSSWGFSYKQLWTWIKLGKNIQQYQAQGILQGLDNNCPKTIADNLPLAFGMGRLRRAAKEVVLVGIKGSPYKHLDNKSIRDVVFSADNQESDGHWFESELVSFAPNLGHSAKPECVQDDLDLMFPEGNRLELFARRDRVGDPHWTCVGNECPSTEGEDIRDSLVRLANA